VEAILAARKPFLIVVSGPSGVGKSTVVEGLLERSSKLVLSVSLTTRPPRKGEREGEEYRFVSRDQFLAARDAGELLEWAEVHEYLYGTPIAFVERTLAGGDRNVLLEIDVQGGLTVKEKMPCAVLIFLLPPSFAELERRLRGRATDEDEVIRRRLRNANKELSYYHYYDYLVVNDDVHTCTEHVLGIVASEFLKRERAILDEGAWDR
jgi:guanylate kinase